MPDEHANKAILTVEKYFHPSFPKWILTLATPGPRISELLSWQLCQSMDFQVWICFKPQLRVFFPLVAWILLSFRVAYSVTY